MNYARVDPFHLCYDLMLKIDPDFQWLYDGLQDLTEYRSRSQYGLASST